MMRAVAVPSSGVEFELWVSPHLPALRRLAATYAPAADREDLVQDTLVRAWAKRETFDPSRGEAKNWLLAVLADQGRKRWRRRGPALAPAQGAPTPGPDSTATDLRRAVDRLPRRQRETVVLFYYVDLPMA